LSFPRKRDCRNLKAGFPIKSGKAIPLEARMIAITDAFDAMTSTRPHHGPSPLEDVLQEMEKCKGKQFDPEILEIFFREKI